MNTITAADAAAATIFCLQCMVCVYAKSTLYYLYHHDRLTSVNILGMWKLRIIIIMIYGTPLWLPDSDPTIYIGRISLEDCQYIVRLLLFIVHPVGETIRSLSVFIMSFFAE